jgi:hypothetical protein
MKNSKIKFMALVAVTTIAIVSRGEMKPLDRSACTDHIADGNVEIYNDSHAASSPDSENAERNPTTTKFTYTVSDLGEATITGATGVGTNLEIPGTIDGHPVVAIGAKALNFNLDLERVTIPYGVTNIGDHAFSLCHELSEVIIPNSVITIGNYAFYKCYCVESIEIGSGVKTIGKWAFGECYSLENLLIGQGVEFIGEYAFAKCYSLEKIIVPSSVATVKWGAFANIPALSAAYFHSSFRGKGSRGMFEDSPNVVEYYYNCQTPGTPRSTENLCASKNGPRIIRLTWGFDSEAELSLFKVYRSDTDVFTEAELISEVDAVEGVCSYEYNDYNVEEGVNYHYWVVALNDIFEGVPSSSVVGSCFGALEIVAGEVINGVELFDFEQKLSVTDDRKMEDFEWSVDDCSKLPLGIEMSSTGVLSGVPIRCGTDTFTVRCIDRRFGVETESEITVEVAENGNKKPDINVYSPSNITDVVLSEDDTQLLLVSASDPEGENIMYVWMVDGEEVLSGYKARVLLFDPLDYNNNQSQHEVVCYVNDDLWKNIVCRKWNVNVSKPLYGDAVNGDDANDGFTKGSAMETPQSATNISVNRNQNIASDSVNSPIEKDGVKLTDEQIAQWIVNDLAPRFARNSKSVDDYKARFIEKFGPVSSLTLSMPTGKKDSNGNDMYVWQDYVAGTDPLDINSVFTVSITMVDGAPLIEWTPKLSAAEEAERVYIVYGKRSLDPSEEWHTPVNALDRFFKVGIEMK